MKRLLLVCLAVALACPVQGAKADLEYTLSVKNGSVLQNIPDRNIAVEAVSGRRDAIPGESPVTGLSWEGRYLPMLVQIGNSTATVKINGDSVKTSGVGRKAPWGLQYADILYEAPVLRSGNTRFTALFSDCFALGEPKAGVGPVRSCRIVPMLLREEWQGGLVYGGGFGPRDRKIDQFMARTDAQRLGLLLNTRSDAYGRMGYVVRDMGKKTPDTYSVNLPDMRNTISDTYSAVPRPFLFQDGGAYGDGYEGAAVIHLDWGYKYNVSHWVFDEAEGTYSRYCGAGTNVKKWALFSAYPGAEDNNDEHKLPLKFANVIVQRVAYDTDEEINWKYVIECLGRGNADIFIGGRYIPGYWVRDSMDEPTVFYDDQGEELRLNRGKTYIALFPSENRCVFTDGN